MISSASPKAASLAVTQFTFIVRSLRHSIRNTEAMIMAVMLPVMLMLLFTYVFGGALSPDGHYVNYVVPGIILLCAGFGSTSTGVDVATDMTNGIIDRFRTMPISSMSVITGHIVAGVARNLFATGIVIGVAFAVGFRPSAGFREWAGALGIIALFILAFTCLFAAIGLAAANPAAASSYGFVLLFLPYLSSAFVKIDSMPSWLQGIARHQPVTPVIESVRGLLTGGDLQHQVWLAAGWCLLIVFVSALWSLQSFRRKAGRR